MEDPVPGGTAPVQREPDPEIAGSRYPPLPGKDIRFFCIYAVDICEQYLPVR